MQSNNPQSGAFLLILILALGILASVSLTSYLVLLGTTSQVVAGQFRTQQTFYAVQGSSAEFIARYLENPDGLKKWPNHEKKVYNIEVFSIPIEWSLERNDNKFIWDATGEKLKIQRRLLTNFELVENKSEGQVLDIVVLLDQSGSMNDDGNAIKPYKCEVKNENKDPMVSALCATYQFLSSFDKKDEVKLSVIPYATEVNFLPEFPHLTENSKINQLKEEVLKLKIANCNNKGCNTNIGGAINAGISTLSEIGYFQPNSEKVIVLVTDGIPTVNQDGKICDQYDNNPPCDTQKAYSLNQAEVAKEDYQIIIYAIGLGENVDEELLKQIATNDDHYVPADNTEDLYEAFDKVVKSINTGLLFNFEELPPGD